MNLAEVYLKTDVTGSTIEMRQTVFNALLLDPVGSVINYTIDDQFDTQKNLASWVYSRDTGILQSYDDLDDSLVDKSQYFVPVPDKCSISEDMLIFTLEGSSLKIDLPDIRMSSKIPFTFQIVDYDLEYKGYYLR